MFCTKCANEVVQNNQPCPICKINYFEPRNVNRNFRLFLERARFRCINGACNFEDKYLNAINHLSDC